MKKRTHSLLFYALVDWCGRQYNEDIEEAKLIAAIIQSGVKDVEYLTSNVFTYHCHLLGMTEDFVLLAIKESVNQNLI
jgi:hypothetical protein